MPKNPIEKVEICPFFFIQSLKQKKTSIRKLGNLESPNFICNERTIRRALKDRKIRFEYLDAIGKYLDLDTRYLSGELYRKRGRYAAPLKIEEYPYKRRAMDANKEDRVDNIVEKVLMGYEVSEEQYNKMSFEEETKFLEDLFSAISSVMGKHFKEDAYGRNIDELGMKGLPSITDIGMYLIQRKEYYEDKETVNGIREELLMKPPVGYTRNDIEKMGDAEIWDLVCEPLDPEESDEPDLFDLKYPELK